jgi:hypothetical protein
MPSDNDGKEAKIFRERLTTYSGWFKNKPERLTRRVKDMTIQEAARIIIEEFGKPMLSKDISKIAIDRGMVSSNAMDPINSLAQTLDKNIRSGVLPRLIFIGGPRRGRLIGLPSWEGKPILSEHKYDKSADFVELKARIPADMLEKVHLATQAKFASSFDETIIILLRKGLTAVAPEIRKRLLDQLDQFDR